jgi:MFS family permease
MDAAESPPPSRLGRLYRVVRDNPDFRRLFAANAVSGMGDWATAVAVFSLLLDLTGSGGSIALSLLCHLLPAFAIGPLAGVLADRLSRRSILVVADLTRGALVLCLLLVRSQGQTWLVYLILILHALASACFEPAQAATFPNLVPKEDLVLASTLENSLWSITLAVGAALGGLLLALLGRNGAFVFDALTFAASAALVRGLPDRVAFAAREGSAGLVAQEELEEARDPSSESRVAFLQLLGLRDLREGMRYVAGEPRVRALLVVKSCFGFTLGGVLVLLSFFGERVFAVPGAAVAAGAGIATLYTARGVGSLLGPFGAYALGGDSEAALRRGIAWAYGLLLCCYVCLSLSPTLWLAAGFLAVANAGGSILWTFGSGLLQRLVPDGVRGRVAAWEMGGMTLCMASSTWLVGHLLDRGVSARALMAGCGLVAVVPIAVWAAAQKEFRAVRAS